MRRVGSAVSYFVAAALVWAIWATVVLLGLSLLAQWVPSGRPFAFAVLVIMSTASPLVLLMGTRNWAGLNRSLVYVAVFNAILGALAVTLDLLRVPGITAGRTLIIFENDFTIGSIPGRIVSTSVSSVLLGATIVGYTLWRRAQDRRVQLRRGLSQV